MDFFFACLSLSLVPFTWNIHDDTPLIFRSSKRDSLDWTDYANTRFLALHLVQSFHHPHFFTMSYSISLYNSRNIGLRKYIFIILTLLLRLPLVAVACEGDCITGITAVSIFSLDAFLLLRSTQALVSNYSKPVSGVFWHLVGFASRRGETI
jgi:hypothetical protein